MITNINSEDRLVQQTFAEYLRDKLGWESVYAYNQETFGPTGTLGRANEREVVLVRDLRDALKRLNPDLPEVAREQAVEKLTRIDYARSLVQHNREFYGFIRDGVPVAWRDASGETRYARAQVIDFRNGTTNGKLNNRFLAVRELKIQGVRVPHYNRRADLVCFVNGLPLVLIELKAVYRNIRAGFDDNLTDYLGEHSIAHAFHHNAFLVVSNGHRARYGSITSRWEHFVEWKRNDEKDKGRLDAQILLDGMLAKERLLDFVENFILFDDSRAGGTRKIVARNQQVLGVNNAVASVVRQEGLKKQFPPEERLRYRVAVVEPHPAKDRPEQQAIAEVEEHLLEVEPHPTKDRDEREAVPAARDRFVDHPRQAIKLPLVERAHPDLGRLGVFWHTQGSGKSYSMAFFAEKVWPVP
jgi:type I restriction enzyme R subunit